jgi:hypothetical protein
MIHTYQDSVDGLIDILGGGPGDQVLRDVRRSITEAYREIPNSHQWMYLFRHGRIITQAPYYGKDVNPRATISYQHSGGAKPRLVTLSGSTWPSWAASAFLRVSTSEQDSFNYQMFRVAKVLTGTTLQLDDEVNPGRDLPSGTLFIMYQDSYELPGDYIAAGQPFYELNIGGMNYVQPSEWLFDNRYVLSQGTPQWYTITGDRQYPGRMVMRIVPFPNDAKTIDFMYLRRPRPLVYQQSMGGSVAVGSGGTTVTCTTGAFAPTMEGSIIRISSNAKTPSSDIGSVAGYNPAAHEATIANFISSTVVTIDAPSPAALSGVGYYVSDPVDFEQGTMLTAFIRMSEAKLANLRNLKNKSDIMANAEYALSQGKAAASPSFAGRCAGPRGFQRLRLRDRGPLIRD